MRDFFHSKRISPKLQKTGVQGAFTKLATFPGVYQEIIGITGAASTSNESSLSSTLVNAQSEIAKLKVNLRQNLHKQVIEKCSGDKSVISEKAINTTVTKIYDAITLDYSSKLTNIEKMIKLK